MSDNNSGVLHYVCLCFSPFELHSHVLSGDNRGKQHYVCVSVHLNCTAMSSLETTAACCGVLHYVCVSVHLNSTAMPSLETTVAYCTMSVCVSVHLNCTAMWYLGTTVVCCTLARARPWPSDRWMRSRLSPMSSSMKGARCTCLHSSDAVMSASLSGQCVHSSIQDVRITVWSVCS